MIPSLDVCPGCGATVRIIVHPLMGGGWEQDGTCPQCGHRLCGRYEVPEAPRKAPEIVGWRVDWQTTYDDECRHTGSEVFRTEEEASAYYDLISSDECWKDIYPIIREADRCGPWPTTSCGSTCPSSP